MERQTFIGLFKDLISRLYDRVAIETHPLAPFFVMSDDNTSHRAEVIQGLIVEEIKALRPRESIVEILSPEWRSYLILQKRYIEAQEPHEIAKYLCIGDRQFRRDHSRALQALSQRVWQRYFQSSEISTRTESVEPFVEQAGFEFHAEQLDLNEVVRGVIKLISRRLEEERVSLELDLCHSSLHVYADRIILRQLLLSLLNYVLHLRGYAHITVKTEMVNTPVIKFLFNLDDQWANIQNDEKDSVDFARKLSKQLPATIEESLPGNNQAGAAEIQLIFGYYQTRTVLVVDDQNAAIKMFQRYLSRAKLDVVGITDPVQALDLAQKLHPAVIILDVMMPHIDGWEVLQTIQLDRATKDIPIIVCSAWGEPELARSLGAVAFIKKPIIQKDLLSVFHQLGILQE
jgi:CheY-like chemotaxis protein